MQFYLNRIMNSQERCEDTKSNPTKNRGLTSCSPDESVYMSKQFENINRIVRSRASKKDRICNCQNKKEERTNNYLQNITKKTKDRATRTKLKPGVNSGALEG